MGVNQSTPATGNSNTHEQPTRPSFEQAFHYQPLQQDTDQIRLIQIEPAGHISEPLTCRLFHVALADKPRYDALSYRWGDEITKYPLRLNQNGFLIGKNLEDALRYLRAHAPRVLFWIDAICINQDDTPERNSQLRIMPDIYFKASTVWVWLGDYSSLWSGWNIASSRAKLQEALCADEYWSRLWIIQEVQLARQIMVAYGANPMDWFDFIQAIETTPHLSKDVKPLLLHRQREKRRKRSFTLRELIEDNSGALCKDPRDKIYGLLGLAMDGKSFPVDYYKSLLDVWTDTMEFLNGHQLLGPTDTLSIGSLVRLMLWSGENEPPIQELVCLPVKDININHGAYPRENPETNLAGSRNIQLNTACLRRRGTSGIFEVTGRAVGYIHCVGPRVTEIATSMAALDKWEQDVQQNFNKEPGPVLAESERLRRAVWDMDDETLNARLAPICLDHISAVRFEFDLSDYLGRPCCTPHQEVRIKGIVNSEPMDSQWKLYQICGPSLTNSPWHIGVAPSSARPGDLICWIPSVRRCVVVRVDRKDFGIGDFTQIIGLAAVSDHLVELGREPEGDWRDMGRFKLGATVKVDARTVFLLLS